MNVKEKVFSGLIWKFSERFIAQLVSTGVSILLARLLLPNDYGIISIVLIFINIANTFVATGFGQSLVQDSDSRDEEFSTMFYCSMIMSIILYAIIFFTAPYISRFYDNSLITPVLRVLGIMLILAGINTIQQAYVQKKMMFRKFFFSTLIGTVISAIVGVAGAYAGWGVWALVAQYLVNSFCNTAVLFLTIEWKPKLLFSFLKAKKLTKYAWRLTAAELVNSCYNEARSFLIGKVYTPADLAFYTKGEQFPKLITTNINSSVVTVLFPAISMVHGNGALVKAYTRRAVSISSYVIMPCMMGLALVADHLVPWLMTDKWSFCIPYLRIACVCYAAMPINSANLQAIKAIGKSDVYLKTEAVKKIVGLIMMLAVIKLGVFWVAFVRIPLLVFEVILNMIVCKKYIGYTVKEYIKDLQAPILIAGGMSICIAIADHYLRTYMLSHGLIVVVEILIGMFSVIIISKLFKCSSYNYIKDLIVKIIKRKS